MISGILRDIPDGGRGLAHPTARGSLLNLTETLEYHVPRVNPAFEICSNLLGSSDSESLISLAGLSYRSALLVHASKVIESAVRRDGQSLVKSEGFGMRR